jgi:putative hydrolase of the HAD superfamily
MVLFYRERGIIIMSKAVFFDLYQTLVRYDPPREDLIAGALGDFGINVSPEALQQPLVTADEFIYGEIARRSLSSRSAEEKTALYARHQGVLLEAAGIAANEKLVMKLLARMQQAKMELVLFDEVAPTLTELKRRGLTLGLISNVEQNMADTLAKLGLTSWLEIIVTSLETGSGKPNAEIFLEALRRAGIPPEEALYIGDQYQVDVIGANRAGMKGILLDRTDHYRDITDCPRIRSLTELNAFL